MIRFFTKSQFDGKLEPIGSDFIRVRQLLKYWPEAGLYKYGEKPDVLIFQKVYIGDDYKFPKNYQGIKILDICDPDWTEGINIVETCHAVDAVTCPTEPLAEFIRQFTKNVYVVPDRFDLEVIPEPKQHTGDAVNVVWFGYSHNADCLRYAIPVIEELNLNLTIISNDDPIVNRWGIRNREEYYTFVKYNEATIYSDLQKADFAVLPDGGRPTDIFKSNNKTIKSNLAGLPVAKTADGVRKFIKAEARNKWIADNLDQIRQDYDVRKSVEEYKEIINGIQKRGI